MAINNMTTKIELLKAELAEIDVEQLTIQYALGRISTDNYTRILGRSVDIDAEIEEIEEAEAEAKSKATGGN